MTRDLGLMKDAGISRDFFPVSPGTTSDVTVLEGSGIAGASREFCPVSAGTSLGLTLLKK